MYRGDEYQIGTHDPGNNFALKANRRARDFADVGGQLEATLAVLHVAVNAKHPDKKPAFSVVVGQIHADKDEGVIRKARVLAGATSRSRSSTRNGPTMTPVRCSGRMKETWKKPTRTGQTLPIRSGATPGKTRTDPGDKGIALGELFNYNINVHGNIMYLTFRTTDPSRDRQIPNRPVKQCRRQWQGRRKRQPGRLLRRRDVFQSGRLQPVQHQ